jgi:hypothetical protein
MLLKITLCKVYIGRDIIPEVHKRQEDMTAKSFVFITVAVK